VGSTSFGLVEVRWLPFPIDGIREAAIAFREVRVFEVREVLRLWLAGKGLRAEERLTVVDRKTVRRYVSAAETLGVVRDGGDDQLTEELIGMVVEAVRPHRCDGHGAVWRVIATIAHWRARPVHLGRPLRGGSRTKRASAKRRSSPSGMRCERLMWTGRHLAGARPPPGRVRPATKA
jgi:hypothetical protein